MFGYFKKLRVRIEKQNRLRGFNFAAGKLLFEGSRAIKELEQNVEAMRAFGDYDAFDAGVEDALREYYALVHGGLSSIGRIELLQIAREMRERKINHGRNTSPTLEAWADRINAVATGGA